MLARGGGSSSTESIAVARERSGTDKQRGSNPTPLVSLKKSRERNSECLSFRLRRPISHSLSSDALS